MHRQFISKLIAISLLVFCVAGCSVKKPYHVTWERSRFDGPHGGAPASLQASTPVVDGDNLLMGTRGGSLLSIDKRHGNSVWRWEHNAVFESPGAVSDGVLYIGDLEGHMHAVDVASGKALWTYHDEAEVLGQPHVEDDKVYYSNASNTLVALNRKDGSLAWRYREDPPSGVTVRGVSSPLVAGGQVIVGFSKGVLVALDRDSGAAIWRQQVAEEARNMDLDATPALIDNKIIVAAVSGPLAAYSLNGKLLWVNGKIRSQVAVAAAPEADKQLFAVTLDGKLYRLNAEDGSVVWQRDFVANGGAPTTPILQGKHLIFGTSRGAIHVMDPKSGEPLWIYQLGGRVSGDLTPLEDGFLVMDGNQRLLRFGNN